MNKIEELYYDLGYEIEYGAEADIQKIEDEIAALKAQRTKERRNLAALRKGRAITTPIFQVFCMYQDAIYNPDSEYYSDLTHARLKFVSVRGKDFRFPMTQHLDCKLSEIKQAIRQGEIK